MTGTYKVAPIELTLKTAWGELKTHVSTFQLDRPMEFVEDQIVPLKAVRRHFRLPKSLDRETNISIGAKELLKFQHQMYQSGDVPNIEMNAIVKIEKGCNEAKLNNNEPIKIVAKLLRGGAWIDLNDLIFSKPDQPFHNWWPNQTNMPSRLQLDADNLWLEFNDKIVDKDNLIKLRPRQPVQQPAGGCEWDIMDCTPYQEYVKAGLSNRLLKGLGLSVENRGSSEAILVVLEDRIERRINNPLIFMGSLESSWSPTFVCIKSDGTFHFADELDSATPCDLATVEWADKKLSVTFAKNDERVFALVGSSDPLQLQGDSLWSYQTLKDHEGWLRWRTCTSENLTLLTNDDPFELTFSPNGCDGWGWYMGIFRDREKGDKKNQISFTIDKKGNYSLRARQLNLTLLSPVLSLYSAPMQLIDPECPPPQLDPEADNLLVDGKLCFVLAENRSVDGVTLSCSKDGAGQNILKICKSESIAIAGNVVWAGPPEPCQAWIFSESIVGRNLVFGPETAWDPHAGNRLVPIENITLALSDAGMTVVGKPMNNTAFQATMALLPWVEGSRDEQEDGIQLKAYHRNLICEIDESRAGREDRGLLPGQLDPLSDRDRTWAVRDAFALLGSADETITRKNFWPGLPLKALDLKLKSTLNPTEANTLPGIVINGRSMQLRTQASNPPNRLPNHPPDWLDYRVQVSALVNNDGKPNPVAEVRSDGDHRLHTSLVIKDGSWLDQAGVLWEETLKQGLGLMAGLVIQQFWQAEVAGDELSWSPRSLLSGTIQLADDASNEHSIELYLESFLVERIEGDTDTFKRAEQAVSTVMPGAWKLMETRDPAQPPNPPNQPPKPKLFGFALEGLSVVSLSEQEVIVEAALLSPDTQTTASNSIKLRFTGINQIELVQTTLAYNFLQMESLPFPHGGLPGQLTRLEGLLSFEQESLILKPNSSMASTLGSTFTCHPPVLRGQHGRWANKGIPETEAAFWREDLTANVDFSCHQVHLEAADVSREQEDMSHAGFLITDGGDCQFRSLYQPDIPLRPNLSKLATDVLLWTDVLICRRQLWLSPDLLPSAPLPIFLIYSKGSTFSTLYWSDQSQALINSNISDPQGGLLIPVSITKNKDEKVINAKSVAVVLWSQEKLEVYFPPASPPTKNSEAETEAWKDPKVFEPPIFPQKVFRIPNRDNEFLLIDNDNQIYVITLDAQLRKPTSIKLEGLPFRSVKKLVGVDTENFIVIDDKDDAWYWKYNNPQKIDKIPESRNSVITSELNVGTLVAGTEPKPRLFLARWEADKTIISSWTPKQAGTTLLAKIKAQVRHVLSTPLGPWWISLGPPEITEESDKKSNLLRFYNMNNWVEWDKHGFRADVEVDINLFHQDVSAGFDPFNLKCRISRGNTLTVTHHDGVNSSFSPAWPRQVQGQYTGFSVPSHQPGPSTIWTRGVLVLWPEGENGTTYMAGAWLRESWEKYNNKLTGTLHALRVDWLAGNEWKHELIVTGVLASTANWDLQVHEQNWNPGDSNRWAFGLLILKQGDATIQLPVRFRPNEPGDSLANEVEIDFGFTNKQSKALYLVRQATLLDSMASIDLALPGGTPDKPQQISFDINPVILGESNHWCHLVKDPSSDNLQLMSVGPDEELNLLDRTFAADFPKQPIEVTQLTHRRVFGARLRFGDGVVPYSASTQNSWNTIGTAESEPTDHIFNLDSLILIGKELLGAKEGTVENNKFLKSLHNKKIWNAEKRRFDILDNIDVIEPGDHFTTWTPVKVGDVYSKHTSKPIQFEKGEYIGALAAQYANSIWLLQEPFWVKRNESDVQQCLTENVLVIGRPTSLEGLQGVEADPAVECLRSVSDLVSSEAKRGVNDDKLAALLLATGSAGVVVRRLFQGARPPEYHFHRSPFSAVAGETSIQIPVIALTEQSQRQLQAPAPSPIHLRDQPWPDQVSLARYTPTLEPAVPRLPAFYLDFRQLSFELQGDITIADDDASSTQQRSILLQEAVCYDNRIQNDPSKENANDGSLRTTGTFHPQNLDLVYAVDKPGGMLSHSLELRSIAQNQAQNQAQIKSRGVTTTFAMRDPRQVIIPPGAELRVAKASLDNGKVDLEFEEVLGTLMAPKVKLSEAISRTDNTFKLNREAVLVLSKVGDELIALPADPIPPYLPLEKETIFPNSSGPPYRHVYLVTRGQPSTPIVYGQFNFALEGIEIDGSETRIGDDDLWITTVKVPDLSDNQVTNPNGFQLVWISKEDYPTIPPLPQRKVILNYYGNGEDDLSKATSEDASKPLAQRLIPALATPKLGIVSSVNGNGGANGRRLDRLELFATAKGGMPRFSVTNEMIEGANLYQVSWRRPVDIPFDALHVIKYFADGQTFCATKQID